MNLPIKILTFGLSADIVDFVDSTFKKNKISFSIVQEHSLSSLYKKSETAPSIILIGNEVFKDPEPSIKLLTLKSKFPESPIIAIIDPKFEESALKLINTSIFDYINDTALFRLAPTIIRAIEFSEAQEQEKKAMSLISEAHKWVEQILSQVPCIVYRCKNDQLWTMKFLSPYCYELTGYSPDEIIDNSKVAFENIIHPNDRELVRITVNNAISNDKPWQIEYRIITKNNSIKWVFEKGQPLKSPSGEIEELEGIILDITEQKLAKQKLLDSESKYVRLAEVFPNVIYTLSYKDNTIISLNPAFEKITGWSRDDWIGKPFDQLIHPEDLALVQQNISKLARGETIPPFQLKIRTKDGSFRIGEFTAVPVIENGVVVGEMGIVYDITEKTEFIKKLQESEDRFRKFSEAAFEGIVISEKGKIIDASPAFAKMFGYELNEIIGKSVLDFATPDTRTTVFKAIQSNDENPYEATGIRKDGSTFFGEVRGRVFTWKGKQVRVAAVRDITDRKRSERLLAAERNLLKTLFDNLPINIFIKDIELRYILSNKAHTNFLGFKTQEEFLGKTSFDIFPKEVAEKFSQADKQVISTGQPINEKEEFFKLPDGRCGWLSTTKLPYRDVDGVIIGIFGISRDITEKKQAELEIKKLAAFPENNPNPILEVTESGVITYANPAAKRKADALHINELVDLLPITYQAIVKECIQTAKARVGIRSNISSRILDWSFYPLPNSNLVHCYAFDITDQIEMEDQIRQIQKMESIGQLAAGIAHDFNNILTVIIGNTSLLLSDPELPPYSLETLKQISIASTRAATLTRQLLTFSKRQIVQPRKLNINDVLAQMSEMLRRLIKETVQIRYNFSMNLPAVYADPGMIEQAIINLASNSQDAMPRGGVLTISTSVFQVPPEGIPLKPQAVAGKFVCIEVSDTGIGMDELVQSHLFEPFFTTKEVGKGTGLGLSTVYGIIKQHNGWIDVESTVGKGSTFKLYFPALEETAVHEISNVKDTPIIGGNETILLVEDEGPVRVFTSAYLKRLGYDVLEASSGPAAISLWRQHQNRIKLLLTDLVMPDGMSGKELATILQANNPKLKVIFTSGYSVDFSDASAGLIDGVNFIQKPFEPNNLAKLIRKCLDQPET